MPTMDGPRSKRPGRWDLWILGSWVLVASSLAVALDLALQDRSEDADLVGSGVAVADVDLAFPAQNPIWFPSIVEAGTGSDPSCPTGCKFGIVDTPAGVDTAAEPTPPVADDVLAQHLAACAQQIESSIEGRVTYPDSMVLLLAQESTYEASLDIRPGAVAQPPAGGDTGSADVQVGCGVGARLDAQGESIAVEDEGEWVYREFSTPGFSQWSWTVRSTRPQDAKIRLELRPAVPVSGGGYVVPANDVPGVQTAGFTTEVQVQAGLVDEASFWTTTMWPKIVAIAAVAGGALLGLITWLQKMRTSLGDPDGSARSPGTRDPEEVRATASAGTTVPQPRGGEPQPAAASRRHRRRPRR